MSALDWISIAAAFGVIAWFAWFALRKDRDRERYAEDDAREYFDEHGHWPDETPAEAAARAARAAESERAARTYQD